MLARARRVTNERRIAVAEVIAERARARVAGQRSRGLSAGAPASNLADPEVMMALFHGGRRLAMEPLRHAMGGTLQMSGAGLLSTLLPLASAAALPALSLALMLKRKETPEEREMRRLVARIDALLDKAANGPGELRALARNPSASMRLAQTLMKGRELSPADIEAAGRWMRRRMLEGPAVDIGIAARQRQEREAMLERDAVREDERARRRGGG